VSGNMGSTGFILEGKDISVVYGRRQVLNIPHIGIRPNEVLVLIGPNGSGKTTLALSLSLLLDQARGTVLFQGKPVRTASEVFAARRHFAMVFQEPLLLSATVWQNVTLGLRLRKRQTADLESKTRKWLDRFGVGHLAKRNAGTLSGGEAKRVSLARAFVLEPEILFLDEPFNALDSPTRQSLLEDFQSVLRETRVTTVMVTHDHNEALALGDTIAVLIGGRIRQLGTPDAVFSAPADEEVANFIEAGNVLHGVVSAQDNGLAHVVIGDSEIQAVSDLRQGAQVVVYLRYEDVTLALPPDTPVVSSARNQLKGKVIRVFPQGPQSRVTADCGFQVSSLITRRSWEEMGLATGREIVASFKASAVHLILKG
jgi:tungstate transport system ATP-binding protein